MSARDRFVACARAQVGKPYKWATAGPDTFDCSGLVAFCYQQATGETITRSSYEQWRLGTFLVGPTLQPGDLVFWGNIDADHVGVYVGNGRVVNALNETKGVVDSPRGGEYGMPYMGARRIFTDDSPSPPSPPPPDKPRKEQRKRERDQRRRRRKA